VTAAMQVLRTGSLAVALGLGIILAPGLAFAEPADSSSSPGASPADGTDSDPAAPGRSADRPGTSANTDGPPEPKVGAEPTESANTRRQTLTTSLRADVETLAKVDDKMAILRDKVDSDPAIAPEVVNLIDQETDLFLREQEDIVVLTNELLQEADGPPVDSESLPAPTEELVAPQEATVGTLAAELLGEQTATQQFDIMLALVMADREAATMDPALTAQVADMQATNTAIQELNSTLASRDLSEFQRDEIETQINVLSGAQQSEMLLMQEMVSTQNEAIEAAYTIMSKYDTWLKDEAWIGNFR
jgi:hypothetical protein